MKDIIEAWSGRIQPLVWNIIIVASAVIIGLIVKFTVKALLNYNKKYTDYSLFRSIITHFSGPMNHFVPVLVLNIMEPMMVLSPQYDLILSRTIQILLIISFAVVLINTINIFEDYVYHTYDLNKDDNLRERKIRTQMQFIKRLLATVIVFITIAVILLSFDNVRKIGAGLLTGVGIGGIIIGFAAQKSLGNLLAGFQIAFTQPIRIDDVLVVEGEWGRVEDITLTYVVLNIWDQRRLILPINYFIEKPFQNWTRTTSEILGTVFLYLDYNTPVDALRVEFDRLLAATNLWDKRVKVIQVTDAKEKTMEIRVLVSASNSSKAFDLRCYIREGLIKYVKDNHPESLPVNRIVMTESVAIDKANVPPTDV
ncbi:mechanosensitive ion channel family protein [Mucilaginibacter sp. BJC16-A38]|uniref:mechanosensitive ion channel family protein n=1 Tax=Mucilaginibacter phenanthrenivorans TaxID=1234842 RepID=UPI00215750E1|nr:mechanosensitive ion channel family protein [Mucilaginibacter phenanthrenivorans]MCR8560833.1 mechanosensitive ion channel family protein [Mucilaginibacter phenanthrenivorans]